MLLWELPCTTESFLMRERKSSQCPFTVEKSQTNFVHRGNIEHLRRSHSICEMGPGDKAFSSASCGLGARRDRPMVVV